MNAGLSEEIGLPIFISSIWRDGEIYIHKRICVQHELHKSVSKYE